MRNLFALATFAGLLVCGFESAGAPPNPKSAFPDFDVRANAVLPQAALAPARAVAEEALRTALPSVRINRSTRSGAARWISAERGFLTGPGGQGGALAPSSLAAIPENDSHRVVKAFINQHSAVLGHDASALENARVARDYVTGHNGLRTVVWEQSVAGIPVFEALLQSHITAKGELVSLSDEFSTDALSPNLSAAATRVQGAISSARALSLAAASVGSAVSETGARIIRSPAGSAQRQTLEVDGVTGSALAQLTWFPGTAGGMRLAWSVVLIPKGTYERYMLLIDAENGDALLRRNLTRHAQDATYNVFTSDSPSPFSPGWAVPFTGQPAETNRTLVKIAALSTNASPLGWIYDGATNVTFGNNVDAFLDRDLDLLADRPRPRAGGARTFNFPLDLTQEPTSYQDASTVQLFYRANWYHDRLYDVGFTEAAGNYQLDNLKRGGLPDDALVALVQAGSDIGLTDNSAFLPAPDGFSGICLMFTFTGPTPDRDGALDQEVVIHELTHGVTERLVGGGVGISELQTLGMAEGWSDWYALALLSEETDIPDGVYGIGAYASYNFFGLLQNYYYGIRRYPYTTDMSKNPLTLKDIDPSAASAHAGIPTNPILGGSPADEVHNMGEVWCTVLWEVRAGLVEKLGFEQGNQFTLQIVTDGLKLVPANPTYLEARDAIILADQVLTGGSAYDDLWIAFAKRGFGFGAKVPTSDTSLGVRESFDTPPDVISGIPDGLLEVKVTPPPFSVVFGGDTNDFFVKVTDGVVVTNATIDASVAGTALVFRNDGIDPDKFANDATYASVFTAPAASNTLVIPVVVSAPDRLTVTNFVQYTVVPIAGNDAFAAAIKAPAGGAEYNTSNRRATIETNEPVHGGIASANASLWWNYNATTSSRILVDTSGSDFPAIVAVYTNSALTNLQPVASAVGNTFMKGPYVYFNCIPAVNYRIAVASVAPNNAGSIRLRIIPGGQPDTNAPTVSVTSPVSGLEVSTNRVYFLGSAVDPGSDASGIKQIAISVIPQPGFGDAVTTYIEPRSFGGPTSSNWVSIVGLRPGRNTVRVTALDFVGNLSTPVTLDITYRVLDPPNDIFVNATVLTNTSGVLSANTLNASKEAGEPLHADNAGGKSAWWTFTAPADGDLDLSTTNSTFDTLLAVYTGERVSSLTRLGANDDAYPGATNGFSSLAQPVRAGQVYRIAVDGYDGVGGAMFLQYSFVPAAVYKLTVNAGTGGTVTPHSGDVMSNTEVTLSATPDAYYQFDHWEGDVSSAVNPLKLTVAKDTTVSAVFHPKAYSEDFESGGLSFLPWVSGGDQPWQVQTNSSAQGSFAAQSGAIGHSQSSSLSLTGDFTAGVGSFDVRVSSEPTWDTLKFYVDDIVVQQWSGEVNWSPFAFPLTAGTHTLKWSYSKDAATSTGLDAAFIDSVLLPFKSGDTNVVTPPTLSIAKQQDGSLAIQLNAQANVTYVMQFSSDFASWSNLATNTATGDTLVFTDMPASTNQVRYYRTLVP